MKRITFIPIMVAAIFVLTSFAANAQGEEATNNG